MEWTTVLTRFGAAIGIDDLSADEEDEGCSLLFDDQHEVMFVHDKEDRSVLMYSEVGSASELRAEDCLMLLKASLLGAQTGGAALSVQEAPDTVILWKRYDDTITDDGLKAVLNDFLAQVINWKQKLLHHEAPREEPADNDEILPDLLHHLGAFA